jgi:hypothetical protein
MYNLGKQVNDWIQEHAGFMSIAAGAVGGLGAAYLWTKGVMWLSTGVLQGLTLAEKIHFGWMLMIEWATGKLTIAQALLNATMLTGPWGWALMAIGAVAGGLTYLWKTSEKARLIMSGVFEAIKQVFTNLFNHVWLKLTGIGKLLIGVFTGDVDMMKGGIADFKMSFTPVWNGVGDAYKKGEFNRSMVEAADKRKQWQEDKKKQASNPNDYVSVPGGKPTNDVATSATDTASGSGGSGSGGSGRNVTVNIDKLVDKLNIYTTTLGASETQIKEMMVRVLVGAVRDSELALSNG